jgi:hypothetical protein
VYLAAIAGALAGGQHNEAGTSGELSQPIDEFLSGQSLGVAGVVLEPQLGFTGPHRTMTDQEEDVVALPQMSGDIAQRRPPFSRQLRAGDVAQPRPGALQLGVDVKRRQRPAPANSNRLYIFGHTYGGGGGP